MKKQGAKKGYSGPPLVGQFNTTPHRPPPSPTTNTKNKGFKFSASWIVGVRARALARGNTSEVKRLDQMVKKAQVDVEVEASAARAVQEATTAETAARAANETKRRRTDAP